MMAKYRELIDKYRIAQSKDTDYNPPSYEWVDNTGEIVRCRDCKHCKWVQDDANWKYAICLRGRNLAQCGDWFCADGEREDDAAE